MGSYDYEDGYRNGNLTGALMARQDIAKKLTEIRNRPNTSGSEMGFISHIALELGLKISTTVTYTA